MTKSLDPKLLNVLACPDCKEKLVYDKLKQTLTCTKCTKVYPIKDNIPIFIDT